MHHVRLVLVVSLLTTASALTAFCPPSFAADWTGWQGPNHDRKSGDTGLLPEWPEGGPKLVWKVDTVGEGFGSMAVVGDRVYTSGLVDGQVTVFASTDEAMLTRVLLYHIVPGARTAESVPRPRACAP